MEHEVIKGELHEECAELHLKLLEILTGWASEGYNRDAILNSLTGSLISIVLSLSEDPEVWEKMLHHLDKVYISTKANKIARDGAKNE